jgi:AraC-like DNA-binding protein
MLHNQSQLTQLTVMNWILAGGGFSLVSISIGSLFVRGKRPITYITSALGASFALSVLIYLAQSIDLFNEWTALLYTYYPLMLLTGTLLFFFFTLLVEPGIPIKSPFLLLFLPVLIATGLMMPYFLQTPEVKLAQRPIYNTTDPFFHAVYFYIARGLEPWVLANILLFLARTAIRLRTKRIEWKPKSGGVIIFAFLLFGALLFYLWVNFFPSELARKAAILVSLAIVYPLYFYQQRNRELFGLSLSAEEQEKYRHSTKLVGIDTTEILARLDRAMDEKKLYMDYELSLSSLSKTIGITPHQLSEILNARLGLNFRQYVNHFRIDAAKECLRLHPERTILDVAFDCGFGSKSAFNTAFSQATGMSPTEWKREKSRLIF